MLEALSKQRSAHVAQYLRDVAASFATRSNADRWLSTDLLPKVLAILRVLPSSGRSPKQAAEVCGAAAAVLSHLLEAVAKKPYQERSQLVGAILSDPEACNELVRWGITHPEAAKQLSSEQAIHMPAPALLAASDTNEPQQQQQGFWTPFAVCMYTLHALFDNCCTLDTCATMAREDGSASDSAGTSAGGGTSRLSTGDGSSSGSIVREDEGHAEEAAPEHYKRLDRLSQVLQKAMSASVLRRALQLAVEHQCSEAPTRSPPAPHRLAACHLPASRCVHAVHLGVGRCLAALLPPPQHGMGRSMYLQLEVRVHPAAHSQPPSPTWPHVLAHPQLYILCHARSTLPAGSHSRSPGSVTSSVTPPRTTRARSHYLPCLNSLYAFYHLAAATIPPLPLMLCVVATHAATPSAPFIMPGLPAVLSRQHARSDASCSS
jgi:hypothetical protein